MLRDFAFLHQWDSKIEQLAVSSPEKWSFEGFNDNSILKNYIEYTFLRLKEEGKVYEGDDHAIFNTGLYNIYDNPIYALFSLNRIPDRQKWFLNGFFNEYEVSAYFNTISDFPLRANYFEDPSALVFDVNYKILLQYSHILQDRENVERFPMQFRTSGLPLKNILDSSVDIAQKRISANYKTAVPQYHKGRIQLLIPLCVARSEEPYLALVVSKNENRRSYLGHTCLTLDMAYNNARLIARPDSLWLKP